MLSLIILFYLFLALSIFYPRSHSGFANNIDQLNRLLYEPRVDVFDVKGSVYYYDWKQDSRWGVIILGQLTDDSYQKLITENSDIDSLNSFDLSSKIADKIPDDVFKRFKIKRFTQSPIMSEFQFVDESGQPVTNLQSIHGRMKTAKFEITIELNTKIFVMNVWRR